MNNTNTENVCSKQLVPKFYYARKLSICNFSCMSPLKRAKYSILWVWLGLFFPSFQSQPWYTQTDMLHMKLRSYFTATQSIPGTFYHSSRQGTVSQVHFVAVPQCSSRWRDIDIWATQLTTLQMQWSMNIANFNMPLFSSYNFFHRW